MALGGDGVISVFSNPYPSEMKQLTDAMLNNDLSSAQKFNNKYLGMMNALFIETNPAPVKFVMQHLGLCENILRLPLVNATAKTEKLLIKEIQQIKN